MSAKRDLSPDRGAALPPGSTPMRRRRRLVAFRRALRLGCRFAGSAASFVVDGAVATGVGAAGAASTSLSEELLLLLVASSDEVSAHETLLIASQ